jgi:hypothetical protein
LIAFERAALRIENAIPGTRLASAATEDTMRKAITIALLAGGLGTVPSSTPVSAQQGQYCVAGLGCVPSTPDRYNACFQLALARGINVSRGDGYSRQRFMYDCLGGRVQR